MDLSNHEVLKPWIDVILLEFWICFLGLFVCDLQVYVLERNQGYGSHGVVRSKKIPSATRMI